MAKLQDEVTARESGSCPGEGGRELAPASFDTSEAPDDLPPLLPWLSEVTPGPLSSLGGNRQRSAPAGMVALRQGRARLGLKVGRGRRRALPVKARSHWWLPGIFLGFWLCSLSLLFCPGQPGFGASSAYGHSCN